MRLLIAATAGLLGAAVLGWSGADLDTHRARAASEETQTQASICRDGYVWVRAYPQSYCSAGYVP